MRKKNIAGDVVKGLLLLLLLLFVGIRFVVLFGEARLTPKKATVSLNNALTDSEYLSEFITYNLHLLGEEDKEWDGNYPKAIKELTLQDLILYRYPLPHSETVCDWVRQGKIGVLADRPDGMFVAQTQERECVPVSLDDKLYSDTLRYDNVVTAIIKACEKEKALQGIK